MTRDPSKTLQKPENRDASGTLQKPKDRDPSVTLHNSEKPGPGTLVGPYKNRESIITAFLLRYVR